MQKVYLLLRDNQQSGPYTLAEIIEGGLKPYDLVWVEGKSAGWSYPSEVEALKPYAPQNPLEEKTQPQSPIQQPQVSKEIKNAPKKIFVSLPAGKVVVNESIPVKDPIEQKAEELRQRLQAYTPQTEVPKEKITTAYARSLDSVEEEYTSWLYKQKVKKKSIPGKKLGMAALVIAVVVMGGGWAVKTLFYDKEAVLPKTNTVQQPTALENNGIQETNNLPDVMPQANEEPSISLPASATTEKATVDYKKSKESKAIAVTTDVPVPQQEASIETNTTVINKEPETTVETKSVEKETSKEKKTLKETINELFKKKPVAENNEGEVATNKDQRNTRRRDEGTEPAERATINLAEQVQVKSNQTSENWMLGVQGLKLTLVNRSNSTVEKAAVELIYYSEQNDVMDKKVINFSNIGPKKSQIIAAPDNRLADHAEYKLISATGTQDGYANK